MLSIEIATELSAKGENFDGNSGPPVRLEKKVRLGKQGNKAKPHGRSSLEVGFRSTSLQLGAKYAEHRDRY